MTTRSIILLLAAFVATAYAQQRGQYAQTTPVPILKQINRHNDDGSYSYGYEGADGSYKIETKHASGEVFGKYGYVDDAGSVREVEYGASKRGFEVSGTDINVPPPTLTNGGRSGDYGNDDYDDGQYREDPAVYYKNEASAAKPSHRFNSQATRLQNFPQQQQQSYNAPQQQQQQRYNPPQQQQQYVQPQQRYNAPAQQYSARPAGQDADLFRGHPATNFDWRTGSYSVNYSG